jgi:hypothetical protein
MERFIIGAAFAAAALFAVGAGTGKMNFSLNLGNGGLHGTSGSSGAALTTTPSVFAGKAVRFEDGVAVVKIIPEDRADIAVSLSGAGTQGLAAPVVRLEGGVLVLDGNLGNRLQRCNGEGVDVQDVGQVTAQTAPQIVVRMPRAVTADIRSGGMADIGPAESLDWRISGCAPSKAGDVTGAATIRKSGSGMLQLVGANALDLDLAGSGVVDVGGVRESLDVRMAGSGEVIAASVTGSLSADLAGSGSLTVRTGKITKADLEIAGSGTVQIVAPISALDVSAMGSGTVRVEGVVGDLDAELAGSGEVWVQKVTGIQRQSVMGSGKVRIAE